MKIELPTGRIAVRWLPVDSLKPDPRNARVHSERQVAGIADSIAAFGFNVPLLVDRKGGVLAGHARLLAARRLGLEEVPTITLEHLDEAGRRAFMIADNRLAELGSWDGPRLALELRELESLDLDFALSTTGFELDEIDLRIRDAVDRPREASAGKSAAPLDGRRDPPPLPAPTREGGCARDPRNIRKDARLRRAMDRPRPSLRRATPGGSGPIVSFAERARTPLFSPSTPASGAGKRSRAKAPASIRQERRSLTPRAPGVARQGRMMEAQPNEAPALRPRPIRRRRLRLG